MQTNYLTHFYFYYWNNANKINNSHKATTKTLNNIIGFRSVRFCATKITDFFFKSCHLQLKLQTKQSKQLVKKWKRNKTKHTGSNFDNQSKPRRARTLSTETNRHATVLSNVLTNSRFLFKFEEFSFPGKRTCHNVLTNVAVRSTRARRKQNKSYTLEKYYTHSLYPR